MAYNHTRVVKQLKCNVQNLYLSKVYSIHVYVYMYTMYMYVYISYCVVYRWCEGKRKPIPCFGGCRGPEVTRTVKEIEHIFNKHLAGKPYMISYLWYYILCIHVLFESEPNQACLCIHVSIYTCMYMYMYIHSSLHALCKLRELIDFQFK